MLERARLVQVLEERRRIARDLHDSYIQVLAALGLRLDVLGVTSARDPEHLRQDLADMRDTITGELRRVRAYLAEMREPVNEIGSLHDLIERTTEAFRSRTQIPIDVSVDREAADVSGALVRDVAPILREALTNVEKHARASRVTVSAFVAGQQLSLVVRDDGVGFSRAAPPAPAALPGHGQGIASMRERVRLLGGTLTLACPDAGGTVLALSIPLPVRA